MQTSLNSSTDEQWLDHEANTVDKQHIFDKPEAASYHKSALVGLDDAGKAMIKKLRECAGDLAQVAGNKWKRTYTDHMPATHGLHLTQGFEHEKKQKNFP